MRKRSLHVAAGSVAILALSASLAVAVSTPVSFLDSSGNTKDVLPVQLDMGQPIIREADPHTQDMGPQSWVPQVDVRVDGFVPEGYDYGDATKSNQLMQDLGINEAVPSQQPGVVGQSAGGADSQTRPSTTVTVVIGDNGQDAASDSEGATDGYDTSYGSGFDNDSQSGGLYHVGSDDDQASGENKDETESQDTQNVTFEMPDGANYKRDEALITISSDATPEEVEELLKSANGVVSQTVTQDDIDAGYVKVGLEPGTSVEDAVNEVLNSDSTAVSGAQPNYVYHLMNDRGVEGLIEDIEANESMELPRLAGFYEWQQNQQAQSLQAMGEEEEKEEDQSDSDSQSDTVVMGVQSDSESQSDTITMGVQSEGEASDTVQTAGAMVMSTQSEVVYEEPQTTPQQVTYVEQEQTNEVPEPEPAESEQNTPQANANESQDVQQVDPESQTNVEEPMPETLPEMISQAEIARHTPNDAMFGEQWGLESIRAPEAWEVAGVASNVYVAVLDNGFNTGHEDLADNLDMSKAYNSYDKNKDVSKDKTNVDHGTHVAGIISAVTDNGKGVAGVGYNAKIIPIKVFRNGEATSDSLIEAYKYLEQLKKDGCNVRVANVSLGTYVESINNDDKALLQIKESFDNGLITVASAGNISDSRTGTVPYPEYPGDYPYIVSVINLEKKGSGNNDASGKYGVSRYDGSNYNVRGVGGTNTNEGKNISAPGTYIISPVTSGKYGFMTGTSMASPHVAGVLALELAVNGGLSAQDAINNLYQTAHDLGTSGWDEGYGWGEVDAYAAVEAVRGQIEEIIDNVIFTASVAKNNYEYDGTSKTPEVYVSYQVSEGASSQQVNPGSYHVTYANNVNAGIATATVSGSVQVAGVPNPISFTTPVNFNIAQRNIANANVTGLKTLRFGHDAEVLNGTLVHIPDVTVTDLGGTLTSPSNVTVVDGETVTVDGGDYDIKATACNKAGTAGLDVIAPVSTIGNYTGSKKLTYTISPLSVNDSIVSIKLDQDSYVYTGSQIKPGVTVTVRADGEDIVMKEGVDYTVQYGKNIEGKGTVTITGTGNLVNSTSKSFTIAESMHDVDVVWGDTEFEYDGESHVPTVSITHGVEPLDEGEDYDLAYLHKTADGEYETIADEPTDAGTYKVLVWGHGDYAGVVEQDFEIKPASIGSASLSNTTATFNGKDQKPSVTVKGIGDPASDYTVSYKRNGAETTDFKNAGTIDVFVTGKGNYKGTVGAGAFTIGPLSIKDSSVKPTLTPTTYTYDGTAKVPSVIVKVNDIVVPSDNYTATYSNNTNVGTGKVTLVGEKNLKDTRDDLTFTIEEVTEPTPIKEKDVEWGETDFVFDNNNQAPVPTIVVDGEGLVEGKDYTVAYYRMNAAGGYDSIGSKAPTSVGTYKVVVTGKTDAAGGGFKGEIEHTFEIQAASLTSAKLSKTSATYNGLDQRPSVTVYANGKDPTLGDYDVTYRRNGVVTNDVESVGTVSVSVTGKGNYTGTVNAGTFTISPLSVNDRSVAVTLNPTSYTYDGTAKTPSVIVRINGVTVGSDNYTVTYLDNTNVGVGRVRIDCNGNLTGSRETTFAIRQQSTPTTPDTKPADTTPTQTTTPTTSTYDPYYGNLYYYLLMRRAMQQQYWNGYRNYWDPYTYYRQQMLMRLWMANMLRPYNWYGYAPSQAYQPYYANSYYGQPRVWNSRYNNYALDYSYNGYNPYTYRNYGYRAPYMDVYPVTVRRSNNYYAPIRTVSPFNVDSDLYKVSYEKVSGEYGIDVDPRTGELSVNPYVQPGMYDVGVRVSGLDRMTGRPYTDVMNANVYVR